METTLKVTGMRVFGALLFLVGFYAPALAQIAPGQGVSQYGSVTAGDAAIWKGPGVIQDATGGGGSGIPISNLQPIAPFTVIGNPTNATAVPVATNTPVVAFGSSGTPVNNITPALSVSKFSSYSLGGDTAVAIGMGRYSSASTVGSDALFVRNTDFVGGNGFIEGTRSECVEDSGAAAGGTCGALVAYTKSNTKSFVVLSGVESQVDNLYADMATYTGFTGGTFSASFIATNGTAAGSLHSDSAAFIVNPNNFAPFEMGFFCPVNGTPGQSVKDSCVVNTETLVNAFVNAGAVTYGLNLLGGSYSTAAIALANSAPIVAENAAGNATLTLLSLDSSNNLALGASAAGIQLYGGGSVTINGTNAQAFFNKAASGDSSQLWGYTNGSPRWTFVLGNSTAESSTATGSDLEIDSWTNAGSFIGTPLKITRSTGLAAFGYSVSIAGALSLGAAAPTVSAGQVGLGSTTAAASNCLVAATACLIVNVAGTTRYIPYF